MENANNTPKSQDKKSKTPKTKKEILTIVSLIVIIVIALIFTGLGSFQIYHKYRYDHFWVNGQSMYPTLNKDAKHKDGTLIGLRGTAQEGNYDVDYGYMDTANGFIDGLKRFDIIVCQYSNSSSDVVKRLIAFPGETFYITMTTPSEETNGNLYIKNAAGEFTLVEQPIDSTIVHGGQYTSTFTTPYTLGEDEYFVMGDNRYGSNSSDSRNPSNKVYRAKISGHVLGLEAYCRIGLNDNGRLAPVEINHFFPWRAL